MDLPALRSAVLGSSKASYSSSTKPSVGRPRRLERRQVDKVDRGDLGIWWGRGRFNEVLAPFNSRAVCDDVRRWIADCSPVPIIATVMNSESLNSEVDPKPKPVTAERLIGFSDGVIAVIITIMVLQFVTPRGSDISALKPLIPVFLGYLLSFTVVGIYWNNHHHMMRAARQIGAFVMWANLHLLFWLALLPFATAWLGQHFASKWPTFLYGVICILCALAYWILARAIALANPEEAFAASRRGRFGSGYKGNLSLLAYFVGVLLVFVNPAISLICYAFVSAIWFIPSRRLVNL